jgi:uncharacterized protein YbjT (DUF2867 family)
VTDGGSKTKIVVTTPTGHVGSRVVRLLVQAGARPTLFLRHPEGLDEELRGLVDTVAGDQLDVDDVLRATAGATALFWVDPPVDDDDPIATYAKAGDNAARAVEEHGVARVVFQSSVGAEKRHGAGEIDGLARTEEALDATAAAVVHLRCGFFFTNLLMQAEAIAAGLVEVANPVDQPLAWVDPRDIGDIATARLLSGDWSGRVVQAVHGPEDLSWEEAVAIITQVTDRELRVDQVPGEKIRENLRSTGMGDALVEAVLEMQTGLAGDFVPEQPRTVLSTTPTTLRQWVAENLVAAEVIG